MIRKLLTVVTVLSAGMILSAGNVFKCNGSDLKPWRHVQGGKLKVVKQVNGAAHSPVLQLGNGVAAAKLTKTVSGSFVLKVKMLHTSYQRGQFIYLMNDDLTKGYGIKWDSSKEAYFEGKGALAIVKYDGSDPIKFKAKSKALTKSVAGTSNAVKKPFADLQLTFSAGELTLSSGGNVLAKVKDNSFTSFSQVVLVGNTNGLFSGLSVSDTDSANLP